MNAREFDNSGYEQACQNRSLWDGLWQECYDYGLPLRATMSGGLRRGERLYDATALDAVDQLASLLLGHLTPPLSAWFGLKVGPDITGDERTHLSGLLEKASNTLQNHFDHSNFIVEFHQSLLDLVVAGTASIAFEENDIGELSAFRFAALPVQSVVLCEGREGRLDGTYRTLRLNFSRLRARYEGGDLPDHILRKGVSDPQYMFDIIEACLPQDQGKPYLFQVYDAEGQHIISERSLATSPFINFRWSKSPGDIYGRSPLMKALPDIKTANKVVELILKNASIAVTGIWQAEDDGVLNPATVELVPGAIIPKAVGSKGLVPLEMPSRFDVSQLVLDDLRHRIRHALLVDRLPQMGDRARTATEVNERSAEMSLLLGATFGRLQVECLTPLIQRAYQILRRRGVIPDLPLDGRSVMIEFRSPLARAQAGRDMQAALSWVEAINALGGEAAERIDRMALVHYFTDLLALPDFIKPAAE